MSCVFFVLQKKLNKAWAILDSPYFVFLDSRSRDSWGGNFERRNASKGLLAIRNGFWCLSFHMRRSTDCLAFVLCPLFGFWRAMAPPIHSKDIQYKF